MHEAYIEEEASPHKPLTALALKELKGHLHARRWPHDQGADACAICLTHYFKGQVVITLPCTHAFHTKCVVPWIDQGRLDCPSCRSDIGAAVLSFLDVTSEGYEVIEGHCMPLPDNADERTEDPELSYSQLLLSELTIHDLWECTPSWPSVSSEMEPNPMWRPLWGSEPTDYSEFYRLSDFDMGPIDPIDFESENDFQDCDSFENVSG